MGRERGGGKVGVVGVGRVGQACAFALVLRGSCRELVLVDRTEERAVGVATDLRYGAPLGAPIDIGAGAADALAGCDVVLITPA
jgi:L-lactate dehydrogenase